MGLVITKLGASVNIVQVITRCTFYLTLFSIDLASPAVEEELELLKQCERWMFLSSSTKSLLILSNITNQER